MGVLHLWEILQPVAQHCSLNDLNGKTLAIDLSGWVIENSNNTVPGRKPHLRNVFFRVSYLLRAGVKLVAVTEGAPPDLKDEVLSQRALSQYGSKGESYRTATSKPSRKKHDYVLRECQKMLESIGVVCIKSSGEAEALCAYLNMKGVVDGCLSDDGDCFLYGGLVVYRNFTMDSKDPHVEMYRMEDIENRLILDRRKLVALALILGCDYDQRGIPGIGKELALKFLKRLEGLNVDALQRFEDWKTEEQFHDVNIQFVRKLGHCDICKHLGTNKNHERKGCTVCQTEISCSTNSNLDCSCPWHENERVKEEWGPELKVMQKALALDNFPNQAIIEEFLNYKDKLPNGTLEWKKPNQSLFQEFMISKLGWTEEHSKEKFIPLLSMWCLTHSERGDTPLDLIRIVKERTYKGIPSFEVEWKTKSDGSKTLVERRDLVQAAYPDIAERYYRELAKEKEKKLKKDKGKIKKPISRKKGGFIASKDTLKVSNENHKMFALDSKETVEHVHKVLPYREEKFVRNGEKNAFQEKETLSDIRTSSKTCKKTESESRNDWCKMTSLTSSDSDDDFLPLSQRLAEMRLENVVKNVDENVNRLQERKVPEIPSQTVRERTKGKDDSCSASGKAKAIFATRNLSIVGSHRERTIGTYEHEKNISATKKNDAREAALSKESDVGKNSRERNVCKENEIQIYVLDDSVSECTAELSHLGFEDKTPISSFQTFKTGDDISGSNRPTFNSASPMSNPNRSSIVKNVGNTSNVFEPIEKTSHMTAAACNVENHRLSVQTRDVALPANSKASIEIHPFNYEKEVCRNDSYDYDYSRDLFPDLSADVSALFDSKDVEGVPKNSTCRQENHEVIYISSDDES